MGQTDRWCCARTVRSMPFATSRHVHQHKKARKRAAAGAVEGSTDTTKQNALLCSPNERTRLTWDPAHVYPTQTETAHHDSLHSVNKGSGAKHENFLKSLVVERRLDNCQHQTTPCAIGDTYGHVARFHRTGTNSSP